MQGSPKGVSVSVKILTSIFNASHRLVIVSAHSNWFSKLNSVFGGWFTLVKWVCIFGGYSKLWDCFGGYILLARDWNLHIIDSQVVGTIVVVS